MAASSYVRLRLKTKNLGNMLVGEQKVGRVFLLSGGFLLVSRSLRSQVEQWDEAL